MKATSKLLTLLALILLSSISAISINAENRFYIDDFTISSGETKELAINLTNDVAFTGFQADIYLPEGLEVEQEDGEYIFDLTDRKGRDHTLSAERQNNGAIRILSYSVKLKEFSGTSGALVNFNVTASDDFSGNYQIQIKNITFATADQNGVDFESTVCNVVGKCLAESITLNMTEASLKVNETTTLTATVLPETATNKSVTWISSNESVATVDADGVVTAIAAGEATITATTVDGSNLSASCKVTVESGSTGLPISVTPASGSTVGELQRIVFEFSAADYPNTMNYDSSKNPLLYNAAGEVVAEGHMGYADAPIYMSIYVTFDAPITAEGVYTLKVPEGAMYEYGVENPKLCPAMELTYTIIPVKAESITLDKTEVEIIAGETEFLTVTILPETTSNKTVVWSSSDEEVAVVNEYGVVTALAVGEAIITATTTDGSNLSASCQVTVVAALAESITLNMTEVSLEVSETTTLTATVLPENTTDKSVTWTSSNESVATVDANGVVTALAVGEATITATTTDGSNLSASCVVTVEALRGFPISITPEDGSTVGELQKIVFEFSAADYPNSMEYDSSKNPILYNAAGEEVAEGHMGFEDAATFMSIYVTFDAPITAEGVYTLKVPAGAMREYGYGIENPRNCPALELTYTVKADDTPNLGALPIAITPADGSTVDLLDTIYLTFGETDYQEVEVNPNNKAQVYNESGELVTQGAYGFINGYYWGVNILLDEIIRDPGTYTIKIAEGDIFDYQDHSLLCPAIELTYTIEGAVAPAITATWSIAEGATLDDFESVSLTFEGVESAASKSMYPFVFYKVADDGSIALVQNYCSDGVMDASSSGKTITYSIDKECYVNLYGGKYRIVIPAGMVKFNGDNANLNTEEYVLNFYLNLPDAPAEIDAAFTANPANNSTVTAIKEITLTFTDYSSIEVAELDMVNGSNIPSAYMTDDLTGALMPAGYVFFEAGAASNSLRLYVDPNYNGGADSYSMEGSYVIRIPAGVVKFTDGVSKEILLNYTVKAGDDSKLGALPIAITPAAGSTVGELQKIVFEFSAVDYPNSMSYDSSKNPLLYNAAGEVVAEGHMGYEDAPIYMSIYVTFDAPITAEGVYTLKVPEGAMHEYGVENPKLCPAMELTYNIMSVKAESITLDKTEVEIIIGESDFLTATILPETASNKDIVWTSSDEEIAVVNEYGVVTAIALGEATITATTTDGSDLSASCKVTVVPVLAMSIELDKTELDAMEMTEFQLNATVLPENTTNKGVVWTSSDNEIASVDETGLVKMLRVGSVVITATTVDGSNLSASCHITIVVGIDDVEGDNVIVATIGDNIVVKNAQLGSNVRVYAAEGSIITSEIATDGDVVIEAPAKGIYIVAIDGKSFKVIVK